MMVKPENRRSMRALMPYAFSLNTYISEPSLWKF